MHDKTEINVAISQINVNWFLPFCSIFWIWSFVNQNWHNQRIRHEYINSSWVYFNQSAGSRNRKSLLFLGFDYITEIDILNYSIFKQSINFFNFSKPRQKLMGSTLRKVPAEPNRMMRTLCWYQSYELQQTRLL